MDDIISICQLVETLRADRTVINVATNFLLRLLRALTLISLRHKLFIWNISSEKILIKYICRADAVMQILSNGINLHLRFVIVIQRINNINLNNIV